MSQLVLLPDEHFFFPVNTAIPQFTSLISSRTLLADQNTCKPKSIFPFKKCMKIKIILNVFLLKKVVLLTTGNGR